MQVPQFLRDGCIEEWLLHLFMLLPLILEREGKEWYYWNLFSLEFGKGYSIRRRVAGKKL